MGERDDAVEELTGSGVLDAVRWAARSAYRRAFEDHDEDAGYTQGSYGFGATTLLQDRLDRVFSTGRYSLGDLDEDAGTDVVALGLDREEVATMPRRPRGPSAAATSTARRGGGRGAGASCWSRPTSATSTRCTGRPRARPARRSRPGRTPTSSRCSPRTTRSTRSP